MGAPDQDKRKLQDIENHIWISFGMYPWPLIGIWHTKQDMSK